MKKAIVHYHRDDECEEAESNKENQRFTVTNAEEKGEREYKRP